MTAAISYKKNATAQSLESSYANRTSLFTRSTDVTTRSSLHNYELSTTAYIPIGMYAVLSTAIYTNPQISFTCTNLAKYN